MSQAHKGSRIIGEGLLQGVDSNTMFLAHYDITDSDVLYGISPIQSIATLREGKYGGGIAVEEGTSNFAKNAIGNHGPYYRYSREGNMHTCYRHETSTSNTLALQCGVFTSQTVTGNTVVYTVSGFLYLNDVPFKTEVPHLSTYHTNTISRASRNDGYFEYTQTFNSSVWIIHSNLCNATIGDTIKIKNLQIEKKSYATSFTDGDRANGILYYPESIFNYDMGTFSCWAKTNTIAGTKAIFYQTNTSEMWNGSFGLYTQSGSLWFVYGNKQLLSNPSTRPINDGQWHFFAVTWENGGTKQYLYVDGKLSATGLGAPANLQGSRYMGKIPIGHRGSTYDDQWWNGVIDEVRIDSVARSEEEIQAWYVSGAPFYPRGIHTIAY